MPWWKRTPEEVKERAKRREEKAAQQAAAQAREHRISNRLTVAAGISSTVVRCHVDTWHAVRNLWGPYLQDLVPPPPQGGQGIIELEISGPQIVNLLNRAAEVARIGRANRHIAHGGGTPEQVAIAERIYASLAEVVDQVESLNSTGDPVPAIVIDDRIPRQR